MNIGDAFREVNRIAVDTAPFIYYLDKAKDRTLIDQYWQFLTGSAKLVLSPINSAIAVRAAELRAEHQLRTPDALQVATGLLTNASVFLTNDKGIRRVPDIGVLLLDELELDDSIHPS